MNDVRTNTYGVRPTLSADLRSRFYVHEYGWLMHAKRTNTDEMFPKPVAVAYDKDSRGEESPAFALEDTELWFAAQHADLGFPFPGFPGGGSDESNMDLMRVSLTDPAGQAVPATELNSEVDDEWPVLSADGLWIYFRSNRPNSQDPGMSALFVAHRKSAKEPFGSVEEVLDLGSVTPVYLSPDFCSLYYKGSGGVYEAKRQK
jgi:hypothetical protein